MGNEQVLARLGVLARAARESDRISDEDRVARNRAIAEADAAGWRIREIARATEMSPSHVQRIITAATADAQAQQPEHEYQETA